MAVLSIGGFVYGGLSIGGIVHWGFLPGFFSVEFYPLGILSLEGCP